MGQAVHTCLLTMAGVGSGHHTGLTTRAQVLVVSLVLRHVNLKATCLFGPHP